MEKLLLSVGIALGRRDHWLAGQVLGAGSPTIQEGPGGATIPDSCGMCATRREMTVWR